ncbi:MAG: hypothetical protein OHK93_001008 [Ramalina farinacea]|uniref:Uncharacterized protein n=1 Tax=Ramalina farinacea TaxID=258253 RepID=A0AA43TX92_9LECA|nr:hypothetical protein [Ramalina farinacea]
MHWNMFHLTSACTEPSTACPLDPTEFGHYPDVPDKIFSIAFFTICAILQLVLGIKWRTWTYMVFVVCGSALEAVGYVGRLKLWANPLSIKGFEIQIICLVLAPAFLSAGIYLSLKHLILRLGPRHSTLRPEYYTRAFIAADIVSLVLQFAGGAIAGLGAQKNIGLRLALIGIIGQVVTLFVFGVLVVDYAGRLFKNRNELSNEARKTCRSWKFRLYVISIAVTFVAILIRCIYR